jgi:hydrogenase nickel incorporation protein HypA/HybF
MHEYAIVQALLSQVEEQARRHGASAIHRLHVSIGELSGVEVDLLRTAYDVFRERTLCENAPLSIAAVKARWACPRCDRDVSPGAWLRCSECGAPARLATGDEIVLDRIEMEVASV